MNHVLGLKWIFHKFQSLSFTETIFSDHKDSRHILPWLSNILPEHGPNLRRKAGFIGRYDSHHMNSWIVLESIPAYASFYWVSVICNSRVLKKKKNTYFSGEIQYSYESILLLNEQFFTLLVCFKYKAHYLIIHQRVFFLMMVF